jgi:hypothetical protein
LADQNYAPHFLFRFGGKYGSEEWSCGLRIRITPYGDGTGSDLDNVSASFLDAVQPKITVFGNAIKSHMALGVDMSIMSMNHISRTGKYTRPVSWNAAITQPIQGVSTTGWAGPDGALAVTLLTDVSRGYAAKGRIYLPLNVFTLTTTAGPEWGTVSASNRQSIATATATFLSEINNLGLEMAGASPGVIGASCAVGVFSPGTGKKQNPTVPGEYRTVRAVRVGGQLDVQQRRLNKVDDLWLSSSSVAVGA